jgi:hypothetical protein
MSVLRSSGRGQRRAASNPSPIPLGRLFSISSPMSCITWFQYDGDALVAEYDGNHNLLRGYVHGADSAADGPLQRSEGAGLSDIRWLHSDH